MTFWSLWLIAGIVMLIIEAFVPTLFFINLAFAAFVSSFIAFNMGSPTKQVVSFAICAVVFIALLRPLILKNRRQKDGTEMSEKYVGQIAEVVEPVTRNAGRIAVFGETWKAMSYSDETIEIGQKVKIIDNVSIVMIVQKM